jgi:hypothetical protein
MSSSSCTSTCFRTLIITHVISLPLNSSPSALRPQHHEFQHWKALHLRFAFSVSWRLISISCLSNSIPSLSTMTESSFSVCDNSLRFPHTISACVYHLRCLWHCFAILLPHRLRSLCIQSLRIHSLRFRMRPFKTCLLPLDLSGFDSFSCGSNSSCSPSLRLLRLRCVAFCLRHPQLRYVFLRFDFVGFPPQSMRSPSLLFCLRYLQLRALTFDASDILRFLLRFSWLVDIPFASRGFVSHHPYSTT